MERRMAQPERVTPKALFELYCLLSNEDKNTFLKLLGTVSTAIAPFVIIQSFSRAEQYNFSQLFFNALAQHALPIFEAEARRIARENAGISDAEFDRLLHERVKAAMDLQARELAELERAHLKQQRDRKPDEVRLERGRIVAAAHRSGVSWKNMPAHILREYPDWFPEYKGKSLTADGRKALAERLRKWARDAEKAPK
jgi:hypothetical protein